MKFIIAITILLSLSGCANPQDTANLNAFLQGLNNDMDHYNQTAHPVQTYVSGCQFRMFTTTVNGVMRTCHQDTLCNVTCY